MFDVNKRKPVKVIIIILLSTLLFACGGGDSGNPQDSDGTGNTLPALVPPTVINSQSDTTKIIIDWQLDTDVAFYQLYWSTVSGSGKSGKKVTLQPGIHSYTHEFLENGTSRIGIGTVYFYTVIAVRGGKESVLSKEVTGSLQTVIVPATPLNLSINNQLTSITVSWDKDPAITQYNIYWSNISGTGLSGTKVSLPAGQASFRHEFVSGGGGSTASSFYYVVTAEVNAIESLTSVEVMGKLLILPSAPATASVTATKTQIQLQWSVDSTVTNYIVYWSTISGTGVMGTKQVLSEGISSFTHKFLSDGATPLAQGTKYFYVVTAQNAIGESMPSTEVVGQLDKVTAVTPQPPALITITPQNSRIQLQWQRDTTVSNYNIYWSMQSGQGISANKVVLPAGMSSFSHEFLTDNKTRLSNGVDFYYVVTSSDGVNESVASSEVTERLKNKPWLMPMLSEIMGI